MRLVERRFSFVGILFSLLLWGGCKEQPSEKSAPAAETSSPAPNTAAADTNAAAKATGDKTTEEQATAKKAALDGPKEPLNVMLLTVDSMRADMPWTGYSRKIAPNLTKLAKESTVYSNAYSMSSYTAKSVSSMLTGRYPSSIYRSGWFFAGFPDSNLFFTEVLQQHKIRTLGGHAHAYFNRGKNLDQGFDEWEVTKGISFDSETDKNVTGGKLTELAISMLKKPENNGHQFFMWLHYMDPHDQYVKHEESPDFGKHNRDRYDNEIYFTDLQIKKLLDYCKSQDWWQKTAVIISADHGEAFGEHGMYKHAFALWEILTRVPLVIHAPGAKAQVIEQRRSQVDLAPTILELMGIKEMPKSFMGHSLVKEVYGAAKPDNREPIVLDLPEDKNNPERHAIIEGDYKLIANGPGVSYSLFNLKQDPGEEKDLSKKEPAKFDEMKALYKKTWESIEVIEPYGGMKLRSGKTARGPRGPKGFEEKKSKK